MKKIFVIGAGRSSVSLIGFLLENSATENWEVTIGDIDLNVVLEKVHGFEGVRAIAFDVNNEGQRRSEINRADIVVSMLPAFLHIQVAKECLILKKHLVTASYVSEELKSISDDVKNNDLIFLNEIGLDPGIDHISAMQELDNIREAGGVVDTFESFTGGLVAPESDNNPWNYKFTWNPRNVVLAGQGGTVKFKQEGAYKYIPYNKLFRRTETIEIDGYGRFEGYANRDSLKYRSVYGLDDVNTIYRGTLRRKGFCRAWDVFVQLGATDDTYVIEGSENMTHRDFINSFLAYNPQDSVELKLRHYLHIDQDSEVFDKLQWLGVFDSTKVAIKNATPAQILQHILEKKWTLDIDDKDMIVMWHKFIYKMKGELRRKECSMIVLGEDQNVTAMAKTVGLPMAIATQLIAQNKIKEKGVLLPISKEIYEPIMKKLAHHGITFVAKDNLS